MVRSSQPVRIAGRPHGADGPCAEGPCWEWRSFVRGGTRWPFGEAAGPEGSGKYRTEAYLISANTPHAVRVHGAHVDVCRLEEAHPDHLRLWRCTTSAEFPLAPRSLRQVFEAWGLKPPTQLRPVWSARQLEQQLVAGAPGVRAIQVAVDRARIDVRSCTVECADLVIGAERWTSIALLHEDAARVREALNELGFGHIGGAVAHMTLAEILRAAAPPREQQLPS